MMTIHTAKGLEFPFIFLCSLEEGVFPSKKTSSLEGMEEERRLAFVAVTRAEKGLFLTDSEGRSLDGSFRYPSRFIFNINKNLLVYTEKLNVELIGKSLSFISGSELMLESSNPASLLEIGNRVSHMIMGAGEIIEIDFEKSAYIIQFDELLTLRKISFRAKLKFLND